MNNCLTNGSACGHCHPRPGCRPWGAALSDDGPTCNACAPWGSSGCSCTHCNRCHRCGACGNACTCGGWNTCSASGASGYLVPRYMSIGRTFQRRITQTLCIGDLPEAADSPLTLMAVTVCGQASWEQISECRQQLLRVTVPVAVQIRDCSGRCRTGHTTATLTIPLCGCAMQDIWQGQLYVAPCIRLAAPVTENEDGCFDATLEVRAEVYLVQLQAIQST